MRAVCGSLALTITWSIDAFKAAPKRKLPNKRERKWSGKCRGERKAVQSKESNNIRLVYIWHQTYEHSESTQHTTAWMNERASERTSNAGTFPRLRVGESVYRVKEVEREKKVTSNSQIYTSHLDVCFFLCTNTNSIIVAIVVLYAIIEFRFVQLSALVFAFSPRHITIFCACCCCCCFGCFVRSFSCLFVTALLYFCVPIHKFAGVVFYVVNGTMQIFVQTYKYPMNWCRLSHVSTTAISLFRKLWAALFMISLNYRELSKSAQFKSML